jgi:ribonuclease E
MGEVAGVAAAGAIGSTSTAPVVNQPLGAENTQPTSLVPEDLRNQPAPKRARPPRKGRNVVTTEEAPAEAAAAEAVVAEAAPVEAVEAELPPVEVRARPKRSRKKAEAVEAEAIAAPEAVVADVVEPVITRPARATRSRKKAVDAPSIVAAQETDLTTLDPVIVAPEPVLAVAKELETVVAEPAPAAIDPNEISGAAPPEKPKRGWWKR